MADFNEKLNAFTNTADTTSEFDPADIEKNKVMAILAYLSWLVLVPIFCANTSKFARFHINQGLVLAIVETAFLVVFGILSGIPLFGWIFAIVESLLSLVFLVFAILGIVNAASGKAKELPVIGKFRILK